MRPDLTEGHSTLPCPADVTGADRSVRALVAALILLIPAQAQAGSRVRPMTNEDVVRMSAAGKPPAAIIEAIRGAEAVAFDLDPGIVAELRRAGVDDPVIDAMREASKRDPVERSTPPTDEPPASIVLAFVDDRDSDPLRSTIVAPALDPKGAAVALALYLACIHPTHVPDLWRKHTPLSSGFPRHRLLLLHDDTAEITRMGREMIHLRRPDGLGIPLSAGSHTLVVGIAARSGEDPWVPIAEDSGTVELGRDEEADLRIRLGTRRGTSRMPYTVEIVREEPEEP